MRSRVLLSFSLRTSLAMKRSTLWHTADRTKATSASAASKNNRSPPDGPATRTSSARFCYRGHFFAILLTVMRQRPRRGRPGGSVPLVVRIDTPIEAAYFSAGGILPYMLGQLVAQPAEARA